MGAEDQSVTDQVGGCSPECHEDDADDEGLGNKCQSGARRTSAADVASTSSSVDQLQLAAGEGQHAAHVVGDAE